MNEIFLEMFEGLSRLGPGSFETTEKAFHFVPNKKSVKSILDIGCGTGGQALNLCQLTDAHITSVDFFPRFLEDYKKRAQKLGLTDRLTIQQGDMNNLDFPDESFDLLWCEGAAFIIGFENALSKWKRLMKPGGCLGISELIYTKRDVPERMRAKFDAQGVPFRMSSDLEKLIEENGYRLLGKFVLPKQDWVDFYEPLEVRIQEILAKYPGNETAMEVAQDMQEEIDIFRDFSDAYSYAFYVIQPAEAL